MWRGSLFTGISTTLLPQRDCVPWSTVRLQQSAAHDCSCSSTACRRKMGYPRTVFINVLCILWTLQNGAQEKDLATTYLLDITSERRNGPHSSLTGGIVWAGALSNCKTSVKVTKNIVLSRTYTVYFLLTQIYTVPQTCYCYYPILFCQTLVP